MSAKDEKLRELESKVADAERDRDRITTRLEALQESVMKYLPTWNYGEAMGARSSLRLLGKELKTANRKLKALRDKLASAKRAAS